MSTLDTIRDSLETALATVAGLHSYARVPGQINPPCAVVAPDSVTHNVTFEGGATYRFPVQVLVQLGEWDAAQVKLDGFVAHDGTAVTAINSASDIRASCTGMESYGLTPYAGVDYLGAVLIVEVLA